jgi:uncharacterized protein
MGGRGVMPERGQVLCERLQRAGSDLLRGDRAGMVITPCEFERTTIDIQFAFDSAGRISGLVFRPSVRAAAAYTLPSYAKPSSFVEMEMTLGSGEWALPGTLTIHAGTGPKSGVLVHGSGPK